MAGPELKAKASLDDSAFARTLKGMEGQASATGSKIGSAFSAVAAPISAFAAAAAAFTALAGRDIAEGVKEIFHLGGELSDLSAQTGVTIGRLADMRRLFQENGVEAEEAGSAINKMQRLLQDAQEGGKGSDALQKLGLNFLQLKRLAPERQLQELGKAISEIKDPSERAATAMDFFGKRGGKLLVLFNDPRFASFGGKLTQQAQILQRAGELFADTEDSLSRTSRIFKDFMLGVADQVADPVKKWVDALNQINLTPAGEAFGSAIKAGLSGVGNNIKAMTGNGGHPTNVPASMAGSILGSLVGDAAGKTVAGSMQPPVVVDDKKWEDPLADRTSTGIRAAMRMGKTPEEASGSLGGTAAKGSADGAQKAREHLQDIRDQVRYQNPMLKGSALEDAVRAQQQKEQQQAQIEQYRKTYDMQHPGETERRNAEAEKNKGATAAGQTAMTTELRGVRTDLNKLVAA